MWIIPRRRRRLVHSAEQYNSAVRWMWRRRPDLNRGMEVSRSRTRRRAVRIIRTGDNSAGSRTTPFRAYGLPEPSIGGRANICGGQLSHQLLGDDDPEADNCDDVDGMTQSCYGREDSASNRPDVFVVSGKRRPRRPFRVPFDASHPRRSLHVAQPVPRGP
jgi:hypothetical protein